MKSLLLAIFAFPSFYLPHVPTTSLDIGRVEAAGSTSTANGVYTVSASGFDIWETQDEFRFVYGAMSGDGEITARVDSIAAADAWTKAGVMIRETLSANSRFAYTLVTGGKVSHSIIGCLPERGLGRVGRPTGLLARRFGCVCVEPAMYLRDTFRPTARIGDSKAPASRSQWVRTSMRGSR